MSLKYQCTIRCSKQLCIGCTTEASWADLAVSSRCWRGSGLQWWRRRRPDPRLFLAKWWFRTGSRCLAWLCCSSSGQTYMDTLVMEQHQTQIMYIITAAEDFVLNMSPGWVTLISVFFFFKNCAHGRSQMHEYIENTINKEKTLKSWSIHNQSVTWINLSLFVCFLISIHWLYKFSLSPPWSCGYSWSVLLSPRACWCWRQTLCWRLPQSLSYSLCSWRCSICKERRSLTLEVRNTKFK